MSWADRKYTGTRSERREQRRHRRANERRAHIQEQEVAHGQLLPRPEPVAGDPTSIEPPMVLRGQP